MENKQMYVADINTVFGKEEEPLIRYIDSIVFPALSSNMVANSTGKTKYLFEDVQIRNIGGEYVLAGLLIKDTILEVLSEYTTQDGLKKQINILNHHHIHCL